MTSFKEGCLVRFHDFPCFHPERITCHLCLLFVLLARGILATAAANCLVSEQNNRSLPLAFSLPLLLFYVQQLYRRVVVDAPTR